MNDLPSYPEKAAAFLTLLQNYPELAATFLTQGDGMVLPEFLTERGPIVTLIYGLNLVVPIPDLVVNEFGIAATLSFSREPHPTFMPWDSLVQVQKPQEAAPKFEKPQPRLIGVPKDYPFPEDPEEAEALQDVSKIPPRVEDGETPDLWLAACRT